MPQPVWLFRPLILLLLLAALTGSVALAMTGPEGLPLSSALLLAVGTAWLGGWLGLSIRARWVDHPRLFRAERAWAQGGHPYEVLQVLAPPAWTSGELGHRILLLKAHLLLALGRREEAWQEGLNAQLARLPLWKRLLVAQAFRRLGAHPPARQIAWNRHLLRLTPHMGRLWHLQGILLLRRADPLRITEAWAHFEEALALAGEDPLVLEDLMQAGLQQAHEALAERALAALRARHGDPRLPWDRGTAALHLLRQARYPEALALVHPLPDEARGQVILWVTEVICRRQLGDPEGAWRVLEAALARHPTAFRLWMERYHTALALHRDAEALHSLDQAWRALGDDGAADASLQQEWRLRRAEFAFWWEDDPALARELLDRIPPEGRGHHHPPLDLQLQVAEGKYEAAYAEVSRLLQDHPEDADLLLLQADCLAGMEAWEALPPYLDGLGEACRERAEFWHLRGLSRAHLGDPLPARADLERAARMDPRSHRYLLDAGHACAELEEWERAEGHWRQALHQAPQSEEVLVHLAEARQELQDPEGARRYLRECLLHHPDCEEAQARLAELEAH